MLSETDSEAICDKLLRLTRADDAAVTVESEDRSHLRFAANDFTTSGRREDASATITVWIGGRRGSATANDLDDAALRRAVDDAEQLARLSPPDDEYMPTLGPQPYAPAAGYVEATADPSLSDRARAIDAIIQACRKAGVVGAGFHHSSGTASARATGNGNFGYRRSSLVSLSVTARAADGGGSGYFLRNHFDVAKLDTARIGNEAIEKALRSRNPRILEPGIYPMILEPQAADDLIRFAFDARSADEGRSPFSAPDGTDAPRRADLRRTPQRLERSVAPGSAGIAVGAGGPAGRKDLVRPAGRAREPALFALLGKPYRQGADAGTGELPSSKAKTRARASRR